MHKEVIIISRYFVPHIVVDSDSVYQMITKLKQIDKDLNIHVVTTSSTYKSEISDQNKYAPEILNDISVHHIKPTGEGIKSSALKFLSNLVEGYRLIKKAKSLQINNIISLSNPPLIALWCSLLLKNNNFFYWTFDVYPDALVADGILSKGNIFFKLFDKLTYKNSPKALVSLGDYQYKYLSRKFNKSIPAIILPCGIHDNSSQISGPIPEWVDKECITIGYIGNIGRAHSLSFLENMITSISNQKNVRLILSIYGFHKEAIMAHVDKLNADNIIIAKFVDKMHLSFIDIHLVSLKASWNNISVPSKAVSAVCSGSTLWFCGPEDSDTWGMFNSCSYRTSDEIADIDKTLQQLSFKDINEKKAKALVIQKELLETEDLAYHSIIEKL